MHDPANKLSICTGRAVPERGGNMRSSELTEAEERSWQVPRLISPENTALDNLVRMDVLFS